MSEARPGRDGRGAQVSDAGPDRGIIVARLRTAGCVFAEDEAEILLSSAATVTDLEAMIQRRVNGFPLEHVVGWAEFRGLRIGVDPGVFVPRARTEFLVEQAILRAGPADVVVDLCCGTGAAGAALVAARPGVELYASDIDPAAVACARRNLEPRNGQVFQGDLYQALPGSLRGRVDLLVVNAPYVPTGEIEEMPREARLHEARVALDGGADGLDIVRRVAAEAPAWLAPRGHLLVESSRRQAPVAREILAGAGLEPALMTSDDLDATVLIGCRPD